MCSISLNMYLLLFLSWLLLAQPTLGMNTNIAANVAAVTNTSFFIAKPGCQPKCGDITVPYPFGIGNESSGCSMSRGFHLTCNSISYDHPKLFLGDIEFLSINQTQVRIKNSVATRCYNQSTGDITYDWSAGMKWGDAWPYTISDTANKFMVVGCDAYALITFLRQGRDFSTGCLSVCSNSSDVVAGDCTGTGCCQINIPNGFKNFEGYLGWFYDQTKDLSYSSPCAYAFLAEQDRFKFNGKSDFNDPDNFIDQILNNVPMVLDFVIGNQICAEAKNLSTLLCHDNTECTNSDSEYNKGYLCSCKNGYKGNPYLSPGCTDIDECDNTGLILNNCHANANCTNTPGSFNCKCLDHYSGDGTTNGTGCLPIVPKASQFSALTLGLIFSFLSLLISVTLLYFGIRRRKLIKLREKFFQQNGGLLMKQKISSIDGTSADQSTKFFTAEELKKATNNYAEDRILGQGGYGVVYKGILPDKRVVAIKKSKVMDVSQIEQFINELLILTQVNHRNVVKVLGCCFESEVPELVYEYISNGTLYQHIHKTLSWLTLDHRLRIAIEAASALSYLHSAASIPIIHRDIKSANILLDSNYVAKIADFGASRLVPLDQTQVSTLVQGTVGYLDPEYLQSSQLTEKSDVYSFGVVLAELLTGKNPICLERSERERNLATYFILSMKENRLSQIWEPRVAREGTSEQLQAIAELVKRCLCLKSEERPLMKEVVMELEHLRKYRKDPWVNQQSHEESESLLSEEAQVDSYTGPPISLSTSTSDISRQYSFNCSMTFPLNSSRY
ncbi:wall-associated receptor kinase 1-like [Rhododendron vialii]|uniref:wall-associated receptor kinase 1-like n=1 Tax=Rhododendron vialii TaxID=182163 RepID=UPI00265F0B0B|nr:wall-associated receptor kinase 1-like [Rhododendron vialii]